MRRPGWWRTRASAAMVLGAVTVLVGAGVGSAQEPAPLQMWLAGPVGTVNAYTEVIDEWNKQNPDVQVTTTFMGDELVKPALLPALNAGTGPDIFEGGVGPGQPKSIIDAGHTLDLSPYYSSLGWDKIIPSDVVTRTSSNGKLWSIGQSVQTTVMFYNKRIFEEKGLQVPTTWEEFLAVEEALLADYPTVVALPAGDGWPISHNQTALWGLFAGPDGLDDVLYGDGRWDDQTFVDATQTLVDQYTAGYFGPEPLAVGYRDALASFFRGEIPMVFTGTFMFPDFLPKLGEAIADFGAFAMPNPVSGKPTYPFESVAGAWYINADTEHPDEAARFLDFLNFSDFGRATLLRNAVVPVGEVSGEGLATLPTIFQEILKMNDDNRANGSVEAFLDTVIPATVSAVTYDGLQGLLTGDVTPADFTAQVQAAWEEAKANGETMQPGGVAQP